MHLDNKKLPLLVPLLEPVRPRAADHADQRCASVPDGARRKENLLPWSIASQYSTATAATPAARGNDPNAVGQQDQRYVDTNGLHAGEHDVKPHGIRRNRTSSAANAAPAGSVRSSRDGNREFFQNRPPSDGPRPQGARLLPAAFAHAPGSGALAGVGVPCPARWPDTAGPPVAATRDGLHPRRLYYSTGKGHAAEKTTSRIPSADKSAGDNGSELAMVSKSNHAELRTKGAPTPEGQVPAAEHLTPLRGVLDRSPPACPTSVQLNYPATALPTIERIACHPVPVSPRLLRAGFGPLIPRNWPPLSPRLTCSSRAFEEFAR